jgi:predicted aconitase with swiveling domain
MIKIQVKRAWGQALTGQALVMREGFSPRYDLDRWTGIISRIGHSAEGESIRDRVLIIPTTKGGVAGGWAFLDLLNKGIAPKALVFGKLNPVMVQGAVLARMPVMEGWDQNILEIVRTGDSVHLDPSTKSITVLKQNPRPQAGVASTM